MAHWRDRNLVVVLTALCSMIMVLLGMLVWAPPLVAEESAPQLASDSSAMLDTQFEGMLGHWLGDMTILGKEMKCTIIMSMDLNGQWLKMEMMGFQDSTRVDTAYHAFVYIRPGSEAGEYRAYLVDNAGSGQVGIATVKNGVWNWVWEWDDGTRETGTMVTSLPNRVTYESRINDKLGNPLPAIEFDLTKSLGGERVNR